MATSMLQNWQTDGTLTVLGGVNAADAPDLIGQSEVAWATNARLRGGKANPRGGWHERMILPYGRVDGLGSFSLDRGMLVASIGSRLYRITASSESFEIDQIIYDGQRATNAENVWMTQTTVFLVLNDGKSNPLIYDGVSIREALPDEVPVGRQMAYGNGRLWVATNGRNLAAGDIAGTSIGSELKFTETSTIFAGGTFLMEDQIRAMKFLPTNANTTGIGQLIVGGLGYTASVRADITDRTEWTKTPGFVTTIPGLGFIGQDSVVTSNQDMFLRDDNGKIRNFRQAIAEWSDAGTTSISESVRRITDHEEVQFLEFAPSIVIDNQMLCAASPCIVENGHIAYRDIVSMDFSPVSKAGVKSPSVFDGQWNGMSVTHMEVMNDRSKKRAFAIAKDDDGNNRLYEYIPDVSYDTYLDGGDNYSTSINRIQWDVEYKGFNFKSPLSKKKYRRADFWFSNIQGDVDVDVYFKSDCDTEWRFVDHFDMCSNVINECNAKERAFKSYSKPCSVKITREPEDVSGTQFIGYSFQVKIVITGQCQVDKLLAWSEILPTNQYSQEDPSDDPLKCEFVDLKNIANEYLIPNIGESLEVYVDENGDSYVDEDGEDYQG